jgi:gamma-glutamyltranspeptidase/glutathione hydrolase
VSVQDGKTPLTSTFELPHKEPPKQMKGVVTSGHVETSRAAQQILRQGGNAFDAAVAALMAACAAEPILTSLGGGGFLLAETASGERQLFDFFAQTPGRQNPGQTEFFPIHGDFGTATQEFHIGMGTVAVPGQVEGLFCVHQHLCSLPMNELAAPAIRLARDGVAVNEFQAYILRILEPIARSRPEVEALFTAPDGQLLCPPMIQSQSALADSLEAIAYEGPELFYRGEIGKAIVELSEQFGGHLQFEDLAEYRTIVREPLTVSFRGADILTNPVPSCGGTLIAHSLRLLDGLRETHWKDHPETYQAQLAQVMSATNLARLRTGLQCEANPEVAAFLLSPEATDELIATLEQHRLTSRGTTQISVVDAEGNVASVTASNGEGSGHLVPGTGIHLNNFLGEQDLMPNGFENWQTNQRMSSMMAPTVVNCSDGRRLALGSGGSNRLRTAITQVLVQLLEFDQSLEAAVDAPRMHLEGDVLSLEPGFSEALQRHLEDEFPALQTWDAANLFFGGVHVAAVEADHLGFDGYGDPRRGGVCLQA